MDYYTYNTFYFAGNSPVYPKGSELSICAYDRVVDVFYLEFATTPDTSVEIEIIYQDESTYGVVSVLIIITNACLILTKSNRE